MATVDPSSFPVFEVKGVWLSVSRPLPVRAYHAGVWQPASVIISSHWQRTTNGRSDSRVTTVPS